MCILLKQDWHEIQWLLFLDFLSSEDQISRFTHLFIYLYRYLQLRVESTRTILNRAFRANIPTTKSQTGNILGVSGI